MTQDRIMIWQQNVDLNCPLCKVREDSHEHLFFQCDYAAKIWVEMGKFNADWSI